MPRSDLTIVMSDQGPNYLQKFTATSFQSYPYVKQYGSRSDLTTVTPDHGPNCLQKFTSTSCLSNSMDLDQTKQLSSLIWVQAICKSSLLHPYDKQYGSRSDITIVTPDLGPNYLKKFTSTSCQLHPYVKQHGFRSGQAIVKPIDPGYFQNITSTSCQLHPYVKQNGS